MLVAAAHPGAVLVRTSLLYGGTAPSKHELAARDPGCTFFTNEIRSPIQVTDLACALLELAELDVSGPLHVAGADDVSRAEFAELIAGTPVRTSRAPESRPLDCSLDSSRAQALLRIGSAASARSWASPPLQRSLHEFSFRTATVQRLLARGGSERRELQESVREELDEQSRF